MIQLDDPVSLIDKVGPKYKKLLEKVGICTVEDFLYYFPFRYDSFENIKKVKDLKEGEVVTVEGILGNVENIFTRSSKRLTRAELIDYTGKVGIVWFNQHYLKKTLVTGNTYRVSGKIGAFSGKLGFVSPEIEEKTANSLNTGRLVPIYPETAGLSSKWLRARINDVLNGRLNVKEFLPETTIKNNNLEEITKALNMIHFPISIENAETARKRFEFEELFLELINVEKRKSVWESRFFGAGMREFDAKIGDFVTNLPFVLTDSQKSAIEEILYDMCQKHPMNRLLEGDVGTGKTVVAVVAAYFAHLNGYKTLYMAPTEILANQHYETFKNLLSKENIEVELKTSSTRKKSKTVPNIIIGTHSLLFTQENYSNVGLVVIDEQHRFGVEQRGKIIEISKKQHTPHLLTMTATPIPRTLALTLYGDLSISALKTHPNKQRKVTTKVITEGSREKAYAWIKEKSEPTFIVCPLIEESESGLMENVKAAEVEYESLKKGIFKDVNMGLLHGRMKSKEKQEVIEKFKLGEIKVLVSTPVIEVGIDVPDATIIVIESAERYGLASLHQLRGRVGRGLKEGYCFTIMSNNSRNAYNRLKYLEEINSGIELAEIDMKLRGEGDVFGAMQHGFKRLKLASLSNLELLEKAKIEAQRIFKELGKYPKLEEKLTRKVGEYISNN